MPDPVAGGGGAPARPAGPSLAALAAQLTANAPVPDAGALARGVAAALGDLVSAVDFVTNLAWTPDGADGGAAAPAPPPPLVAAGPQSAHQAWRLVGEARHREAHLLLLRAIFLAAANAGGGADGFDTAGGGGDGGGDADGDADVDGGGDGGGPAAAVGAIATRAAATLVSRHILRKMVKALRECHAADAADAARAGGALVAGGAAYGDGVRGAVARTARKLLLLEVLVLALRRREASMDTFEGLASLAVDCRLGIHPDHSRLLLAAVQCDAVVHALHAVYGHLHAAAIIQCLALWRRVPTPTDLADAGVPHESLLHPLFPLDPPALARLLGWVDTFRRVAAVDVLHRAGHAGVRPDHTAAEYGLHGGAGGGSTGRRSSTPSRRCRRHRRWTARAASTSTTGRSPRRARRRGSPSPSPAPRRSSSTSPGARPRRTRRSSRRSARRGGSPTPRRSPPPQPRRGCFTRTSPAVAAAATTAAARMPLRSSRRGRPCPPPARRRRL
jgi:hypothetical protein